MTDRTRPLATCARLAAAIAVGLMLLLVPSAAGTSAPAPGAWCPAYNAGHGVVDIIGDSIMDGMPESAPNWHVGLWDWLRTEGKTGTQVWDGAAVGGSHVADFLPGGSLYGHTQFAIAHSPQLIVIGLGTNAHLSNLSPAVFESQYRQLLSILPPNSTKLIVHNNWVDWVKFPRQFDQRAYRAALERISADTGSPMLRLSDKLHVGTAHYMPDGVHASVFGEFAKFEAFRDKLAGLCT